MRQRIILIWWAMCLVSHPLQAQTVPRLSEFQSALDRANGATHDANIAANIPGYQGSASDLQARSGQDIASLQSDGAALANTNILRPSLLQSQSYIAANPVSENAAWVRGALDMANDPTGLAGSASGANTTACQGQSLRLNQTSLYSCETGNQITVTNKTCQIFEEIIPTSTSHSCQTDSYYEAFATYPNISDYYEAHMCQLVVGKGGLNTGSGCGFMINRINSSECAPPKQIGSSTSFLQYCKTVITAISGITYLGHRSNSCAALTNTPSCKVVNDQCSSWLDQATGFCGERHLTYSCGQAGFKDLGLNTTACAALHENPTCQQTASHCVTFARDEPEIMAALSLAADSCLRADITYSCDQISGSINDCQVPSGCSLKSRECIDPNQSQTSACQTYTLVYACQTSVTVSSNHPQLICDASWVNGTAVIAAGDDPDNDLPQAMSAINALKAASSSYSNSKDLTIFGGEALKCGKSIGGLTNCCKDSGLLLDNNLTQCNTDEQKLAAQQSKKACHYVGTYCSNKSLFGCLMKKMSYCCYGSVLSRIIEEAGHSQLGLSWGDAKSPQCGGFSVTQFQQIDLTQVDFTDFYADRLQILGQNDPNATVNAITASIKGMNQTKRPVR